MADLLQQKLQLEIVTPQARVLSIACDEVRAPGTCGGFGVRPGHTPFLTQLAAGALTYVVAGREVSYAIAGGFCEVAENRVTVLADFAEAAAGIDLAQAVRAHDAGVQKLHELQRKDEAAFHREAAEVRRAAARVAAARTHH
ncbi:MAG: F0F1 ATP synthase subunit epsilon [Deltaproteobacteria bacterium]